MEGDHFFIDIIGKGASTVRGIVRWGETYFVVKDVCKAAWIHQPSSVKAKLQPGERIRANINGRSVVLVSIAGLIGLVPNKPEFYLARKCVAELIRRGAIKLESEDIQNEE